MFQEWLKDYEKLKKNNNMSEKEIIKICRILCGKKNKKGKREYPLFASLQLQEYYSKDEIAEAIESLLDLYIAEKEKNKKIKDGILFVGRRSGKDAEQKMILDEYIRKDKIKEILKKDRDCMSLGYYSAYIGLIDDIQRLLYEE